MATKDTTYNGWTNYETWVINLWMDNEPSEQQHAHELARDAWGATDDADDALDRAHEATTRLATMLERQYDDEQVELLDYAKRGASVWSDLMSHALGNVNWAEIAGHLIEAVQEAA
jgi:hypothetical protein